MLTSILIAVRWNALYLGIPERNNLSFSKFSEVSTSHYDEFVKLDPFSVPVYQAYSFDIIPIILL